LRFPHIFWADARDGSTMPLVDLPFHLLTETEKTCLRLVDQGYTSKRIAAARGVRRDRIDKVLRVARTKLNQPSRHEAARRLAEHEAGLPDQLETVDEAGEVVRLHVPTMGVPTVGLDGHDDRLDDAAVNKSNPDTMRVTAPPSARRWLDVTDSAILRSWLFGSSGSLRNDLDIWSRTTAICVIAAVAACAAAALIPLFIVLDRFAVAL
jgi:DNA-binding CsgD family transcriptional regulator